MTRMPETVTDLEIDAYLNEQLDLQGRIAVESALAANPALAAQVMADLRVRDTLRAATAAPAAGPGAAGGDAVDLAARRLQRGLGRQQLRRSVGRGAFAAACVALGWLVHWQVSSFGGLPSEAAAPPPRFVTEAVQAHRTSLLRARMESQLEAPEFDRREILHSTAIALPQFPSDWRVLDVQVYPAALGSSVVVMFRTADAGPFSLYMAHLGSERSVALRMARQGEKQVAYWREGKLGMALTGQASAVKLRRIATLLAAI
ncbi:hypothetical protein [Roseomonas sp. USHLN139]|uniref:hypothetical protein n=1 Tax=Roseomonas sp. USHLN139 TaxID=3081298 RepID=UPI003B0139C8